MRYRDVDRLDDGATGYMHGRCHVVELLQVVEIFERGVTPHALHVAHEGRAIRRGYHCVSVADAYRAFRVACMMHVRRRNPADQLEQFIAPDAHAIAVDFGAGLAPVGERFFILEVATDLLGDAHREIMDQFHPLLVGDFHDRDAAFDFRMVHHRGVGHSGATGGAAALASASTTHMRLTQGFEAGREFARLVG